MIWRQGEAERQALIEAAATAYRTRDARGRVRFAPAWHDLAPADRETAFDAQHESRLVERALDPAGLSHTVRCVLARVV